MKTNDKCYLSGISDCSSKISSEHYISESVLRNISSTNALDVQGLPWIPEGETRAIGISCLTSNFLCEKHNSELSLLDQEATTLFEGIRIADQDQPRRHRVEISGDFIERWLLKCALGIIHLEKTTEPDISDCLKKWLLGYEGTPKQGVVFAPQQKVIHGGNFGFQSFRNSDSNALVYCEFLLRGLQIELWFDHHRSKNAGIARPAGFKFEYPKGFTRIKFDWQDRIQHQWFNLNRVGSVKTK